MPRIMPAIIDSHGNPGIGGKAIGVEIALELETTLTLVTGAVVGVLTIVLVTTEVLIGVVELVAISELVLIGVVKVELTLVVTGEVDAIVLELLLEVWAVELAATVVPVTPPGGSR
jgi:hypothetical protein